MIDTVAKLSGKHEKMTDIVFRDDSGLLGPSDEGRHDC